MRQKPFLIIVALLFVAFLAAAAPAVRGVAVSIAARRFSPPSVTITSGDAVVWTNRDQVDHTIEADDGSFESGKLKSGQSYTRRFTNPGAFGYSCGLHPREKGKIVVQAAPRR